MSHYKEKANQKFVVTTEHRHVKNIWEIVYYINYEGVFVLGDKEIPYEKYGYADSAECDALRILDQCH